MNKYPTHAETEKRFPFLFEPYPYRDLTVHLTDQLAQEVAQKRDDIIRDAINGRIGIIWSLEALKGRLASHASADGREERLSLDGKLLVIFHPVKMRTDLSGKLHVSLPYQTVSRIVDENENVKTLWVPPSP